MATIISGKDIGEKVRAEIIERIRGLRAAGIAPCLAVVLVGDDPASAIYVRSKEKACGELGIVSRTVKLPEDIAQGGLVEVIEGLNADDAVHGILVQMPLPASFRGDPEAILSAVDPAKDVDGFHPINSGNLLNGRPSARPCTPKGILRMLDEIGCDLVGKEAVVVGRSNIVGKPMALLLLERNATVTVCHSRTRDLATVTRRADVLVTAVGRPKFITADMVKPGAVVIDVGINRREGTRKITGDVDFDAVAPIVSAITPVPGGVGPMTIVMLMESTVAAAEARLL